MGYADYVRFIDLGIDPETFRPEADTYSDDEPTIKLPIADLGLDGEEVAS